MSLARDNSKRGTEGRVLEPIGASPSAQRHMWQYLTCHGTWAKHVDLQPRVLNWMREKKISFARAGMRSCETYNADIGFNQYNPGLVLSHGGLSCTSQAVMAAPLFSALCNSGFTDWKGMSKIVILTCALIHDNEFEGGSELLGNVAGKLRLPVENLFLSCSFALNSKDPGLADKVLALMCCDVGSSVWVLYQIGSQAFSSWRVRGAWFL